MKEHLSRMSVWWNEDGDSANSPGGHRGMN